MASVGIVIAVIDYIHDAKGLPACRRDGAAMMEILQASGRFEEILHIDSETVSTKVKQRLADFVSKHKGKSFDEVFFYFTGHGEFSGDEFYYLLSDYQQRKLKQTSLQNAEIDSLVRSLNPSIYVKIIDACHSGMTYIKSPDELRDYLKAEKATFKKLYFFFSSQFDQISCQSKRISDFAGSFLNAIAKHEADTIRCKDIIDSISDDFDGKGVQTPLFINQADFTEIFCEVTPALRSRLASYIQDDLELELAASDVKKDLSLADRLMEDAKRFCSKEEAIAIYESLQSRLDFNFLSPDIGRIYRVVVTVESKSVPGATEIGKWVEQNKLEKGYFANVATESRSFKARVPKDTFGTAFAGLGAFGRGLTDENSTEVTQ